MPVNRFAVVTTLTAADKVIGGGGFIALHAIGSAAASTITILDGTDIKYKLGVATTADVSFIIGTPVAFQNLTIDLTGTASYSITYTPTA